MDKIFRLLVCCEESQRVCAEEWRDIPGFNGYQASTFGNIRSVDRTIIRHNGSKCSRKGMLLKPTISSGYYSVNLSTGEKIISKKIHVLVALTFLGERPDGYDIRHKDGNKLNNALSNIEYGTRSENMLDGYKIYGKTMNCQKLSPQIAKAIRKEHANGSSYRELARKYKVCKTTIGAIIRQEIYKDQAISDQYGKFIEEQA